MDNAKIDIVINTYFNLLPKGGNFSDIVYDFSFEHKEQLSIKKTLKDENILIDWGNHGNLILSKKGEEIVNIHGGFKNYIENKAKENAESARLENIKKEKLIHDAKISKWQVKTFWYIFIFGLIGGVYAVYSIIDSIFGVSEEQKIEHMIHRKLLEQEVTQNDSTFQFQPDSLARRIQ